MKQEIRCPSCYQSMMVPFGIKEGKCPGCKKLLTFKNELPAKEEMAQDPSGKGQEKEINISAVLLNKPSITERFLRINAVLSMIGCFYWACTYTLSALRSEVSDEIKTYMITVGLIVFMSGLISCAVLFWMSEVLKHLRQINVSKL